MNHLTTGTALSMAVVGLLACTTARDYKLDANERCVESYTWTTTANGGGGPMICPGWFRERQLLDAPRKAVRK